MSSEKNTQISAKLFPANLLRRVLRTKSEAQAEAEAEAEAEADAEGVSSPQHFKSLLQYSTQSQRGLRLAPHSEG